MGDLLDELTQGCYTIYEKLNVFKWDLSLL